MDYLLRDAHYSGVPYGTVDAHRLIRSTILTEYGIVLAESGIGAAESLLIARTLMRPAVYFHHVSRIAESMVKQAAVEHIDAVGSDRVVSLLARDDAAFFRELLESPSAPARELMMRLYTRRLYKRALYVGKEQVNPASIQDCGTCSRSRAVAGEIAAHAGVDPAVVLVDIPPFPSRMSMEVQVRNRHDLVADEGAEREPARAVADGRLYPPGIHGGGRGCGNRGAACQKSNKAGQTNHIIRVVSGYAENIRGRSHRCERDHLRPPPP
jgi:HD superfamily phosphohydrolase